MEMSVPGQFLRTRVGELQHEELNCVRGWRCPAAAGSPGPNHLAACVSPRAGLARAPSSGSAAVTADGEVIPHLPVVRVLANCFKAAEVGL